MTVKRIHPTPDIIDLVREFVLLHAVFDQEAMILPKCYPVVPEEGIIFVVKGQLTAETPSTREWHTRPRSFVFGLPASRQNLHISKEYLMICVRFQPGGLFRLFGLPMTEMVHNYIDADLVFGSSVKYVLEELENASCYTQMIIILTRFLKGKMNMIQDLSHPIDSIGRFILHDPLRFDLKKVSGQACLSARQFERKFSQQIGIAPKRFARICRFYQAWELKEIRPTLDWLSIAVRTGYSDYQHLVKDFKEFAGTTPTLFIEQCKTNPERMLNLSPDFTGA